MEPKRRRQVDEWLQIAADDLRLAEYALTVDPPLTAQTAFHAQQAVEKAFKGFLIAANEPYPIHA
jgi:HEPN domain-containing protein